MYILIYETNNYLKICVLYSVFLCRTYRGKGKDKTPLHNEHWERSYNSENQHSGFLQAQYVQGTKIVRPGYHDSTLGVPSEGTLLNVYTIKDKP